MSGDVGRIRSREGEEREEVVVGLYCMNVGLEDL